MCVEQRVDEGWKDEIHRDNPKNQKLLRPANHENYYKLLRCVDFMEFKSIGEKS